VASAGQVLAVSFSAAAPHVNLQWRLNRLKCSEWSWPC
jgi:hypothetical protein